MTSTEFRIGLNGERNSSKVLKPPGGGSSDIFGAKGFSQEPSNQSQTKDRLFGTSVEPATPSKSNRMKSDIFGREEQSIIPKQSKKKYVQRNPITGETVEIDFEKNGDKNEEGEVELNGDVAKEDQDEQDVAQVEDSKPAQVEDSKPAQVEDSKPAKPTSVRVRQPPGGKSSGIF